MNDDWRRVPTGVLLCAFLFYLLLPFLGTAVWHRVLPEHGHVFVDGNLAHPVAIASEEIQTSPCADASCDSLSWNGVVHLPDSSSIVQLLDNAIGLFALLILAIPLGRIEPVPAFVLIARSSVFPPLDPPPTSS